MSKFRAVEKYCGYLHIEIVGVDDEYTEDIDFSKQCEHFYSRGWNESIESEGMQPMYSVIEIDIPQWLIDGIVAGKLEGRWRDIPTKVVAGRIVAGSLASPSDWTWGLRILLTRVKLQKFHLSLQEFFASKGYLTIRQVEALGRNLPR